MASGDVVFDEELYRDEFFNGPKLPGKTANDQGWEVLLIDTDDPNRPEVRARVGGTVPNIQGSPVKYRVKITEV